MSTRTSKIYFEHSGLEFHVYKELHDGLVHLEINDNSNSSVNTIIPEHLVVRFLELWDKTNEKTDKLD